MRVSPTMRLGSGKQPHPAEHFSANAVLSKRLWFAVNSTSRLLPQQGFSRIREEELQETLCLLGLAFPGSMFASCDGQVFLGVVSQVQGRRLVASPWLHHGEVAKELLSTWAQRLRTGMFSAQTPSSEWSPFPCPNLPLVLP